VTGLAVYLAGAYPRRFELRGYRDDLLKLGMTVTASWIDQDFDDDNPAEDELAAYARMDLDQVAAADAAVFFTAEPSTRGGMWVELGYALASDLRVLVVGPHANVFTRLAVRYDTWDDARAALAVAARKASA
jgi:nucleoside 2-deoxyribosyltransferase